MAVKYSHYLIADNMGIHDYYKEKYGKESKFLAYGADIHDDFKAEYLEEFGLKSEEYYILIARLEPENNIVMAIEGYLHSKENGRRPLIVVGKTNTPHGKELVEKYGNERNVEFVGGIYDFKSWIQSVISQRPISTVTVWEEQILPCLRRWRQAVSSLLMTIFSTVPY